MKENENKTVFVTVGTTKFDKLVESVTSPTTLQKFVDLGYSRVVVQRGNGEFEPEPCPAVKGLTLEHYQYKPSIKDDIDNASLVVSHAGAGSVLETLGARKPLLVVINEDLMGNHQIELAHQLSLDQHLYYCTCSDLLQTLDTVDFTTLKQWTPGQPKLLADYLDGMLGFT